MSFYVQNRSFRPKIDLSADLSNIQAEKNFSIFKIKGLNEKGAATNLLNFIDFDKMLSEYVLRIKADFLSWQKSLAYSRRIFVDSFILLSPLQRVFAAWFKMFN